jgi:hypothetical protein
MFHVKHKGFNMIGQSLSSSQNAIMIQFIGGPHDGECGLFDHGHFDSIQFADGENKCSWIYEPNKSGPCDRRGWHFYKLARKYEYSR